MLTPGSSKWAIKVRPLSDCIVGMVAFISTSICGEPGGVLISVPPVVTDFTRKVSSLTGSSDYSSPSQDSSSKISSVSSFRFYTSLLGLSFSDVVFFNYG